MKAILVIDFPKNCWKCDVRRSCEIADYTKKCRHEDCPLRPLPEKNTWDITKNGHVTEYAEGYNACLDEIVGDE